MNKKDYYDILGLSQGCTTQDVKKNYHKLALVWHPDKHANKPEAQKKFTEINEAYSILIDAKKRQLYDTYGHKGLVEESGLDGYSGINRKNIFKEKNFAGTNKSAFDVLRDIFAENEEDDFLHTFNPFNMSDTFRSTFKDFMEENIYSSSENEEEDSFFKSYIPTFMDTSFFSSPPLFQSLFSTQNSDSSQPHHTQFFSFFSSSMDSDTQSYSKTSSIYVNTNGKVQTSTKQRVQKGDTVIENEENNEYNNRTPPLDNKSRMKPKYDLKASDLIFIEDDESPENPKTRTKKAKKTGKRESQNEHDGLKKTCRFFDFESISDDDDDDDAFGIFGEKGLDFKKKCSKKTKI